MPLHRKCAAEFFGTFCLVFTGTGAIIVNDMSGALGHGGVALTFGLIVMAMIYAVGDISGAHLNPGVTIGFWAARRFETREVLPYIGAQCMGALAASALLCFLFSNQAHQAHLGTTQPTGSALQSLILEAILTWLLMVVILSVSIGAKEKGITAGITIGAVIGLEALFAGPICGASMNPARSIGPALISGNVQHLWIYLMGPVCGALLAVPTCCLIQEPGCCLAAKSAE